MKIIGNLYIPINNILLLSNEIKQKLSLPLLNDNDIKIIKNVKQSNQLYFLGGQSTDTKKIILDSSNYLKSIKELSFYEFLLNKIINDAKLYASFDIKTFLIENIDFFYLNEPVIYWIIRALSLELKKICTEDFQIGLKFNNNDNLALNIACHDNLDFIYAEEKNIPELYLQRNLSKKNIKIFIDYNEKNYKTELYDGFIISRLDTSYDIYQNIKNKPLILKIKNTKIDFQQIDYIDYIMFNESIRINQDKNQDIDIEKLKGIKNE